MILKPDTFYFIKRKVPRYGGGIDDLMVCQTQEDWHAWTDDWQKARGFGFKVLGNVDSYEYQDEYPESDYDFIEIPKPE